MSEPALDDWECPVCFLPRDSVAGTVRPSCKHEICLPCYCQLRDRSADPICVLCRATYWRRPNAQPQAHNFYDEPAGYAYAYEAPVYEPYTEAQVAQMRAAQLVPFREISPGHGLRTIRIASLINPGRAEARRQARLVNRPKLSSLSYREIFKLLSAPAVYDDSSAVVPPAAINYESARLRQARILGLQKKSEAERQVKADKLAARTTTKGAALGSLACDHEARSNATKVFRTIKPPTKKFRIGDYHQPSVGPMGKCVGHHLWLYDDGTYIRKGVTLPPREALTISV